MFKRSLPVFILLALLALTSCAGVANGAAAGVPAVKGYPTFIHFFSDECPNCLVMIPIVDSLAVRYDNKMIFETLNVETDGKDLFNALGLHGQPVFVIMQPDGAVVYKGFGRVPEPALDSAIRNVIGV